MLKLLQKSSIMTKNCNQFISTRLVPGKAITVGLHLRKHERATPGRQQYIKHRINSSQLTSKPVSLRLLDNPISDGMLHYLRRTLKPFAYRLVTALYNKHFWIWTDFHRGATLSETNSCAAYVNCRLAIAIAIGDYLPTTWGQVHSPEDDECACCAAYVEAQMNERWSGSPAVRYLPSMPRLRSISARWSSSPPLQVRRGGAAVFAARKNVLQMP